MTKINYSVRDGWRLICRHWGMSFLTVFTAMSVFFIIGACTLFVLNVKNIVAVMENQLTIEAYIRPGADAEATAKSVRMMPNVREVRVITKDMAIERLRARIGAQADAVSLLGENPLPESLEVHVERASSVPDTARMLVALPDIDDIVYAGRVADKLTKVSNFVENMSLVMLLIAIIASGIVLFNTVRIAVYSREEEIKVMMMVGATSTYVAMPFIIQGVILGFLGALTAFGLLVGTYCMALTRLKDMLPFFPFIEPAALLGRLGLLLICSGVAVSLIASLIAVEKFIRKSSKPL